MNVHFNGSSYGQNDAVVGKTIRIILTNLCQRVILVHSFGEVWSTGDF